MKTLACATLFLTVWMSAVLSASWDETEITGYHFHTYYFQDNAESKQVALEFRRQVHSEVENGVLAGCSVNQFNLAPRGPHPIGSFETCCNASSISRGLSWFMKNRGNHSVLLHPLTRYEVVDHTDRAMFLGPKLFLDISTLPDVLDEDPICPEYQWQDGRDLDF